MVINVRTAKTTANANTTSCLDAPPPLPTAPPVARFGVPPPLPTAPPVAHLGGQPHVVAPGVPPPLPTAPPVAHLGGQPQVVIPGVPPPLPTAPPVVQVPGAPPPVNYVQGPPIPIPHLRGTTQLFNSIIQNSSVISANYDFGKAFQRAIKVFVMSYPEIDNTSPQNEQDKLTEFTRAMGELFLDTNAPDMSFFNQMIPYLQTERFRIIILCKKLRGGAHLKNPRLVANVQGNIIRKRTGHNQRGTAPLHL